ncbi:MAG: MBL fold metallo-hydrolase [Saprospirales bacterium]|nr:MAG: MBL fold metallo-hydrolase [Saprospirales bacterium]
MKISFHGAVSEVTGSAHLIELDSGYRILLDCGLFQGGEDVSKQNREWGFDPASIDCVIMSHAHIDHIGRLPKLVKDGFDGVVYSTPATRSLALIMLLDSAKIQQYDAEYESRKTGKKIEPLYDTDDVYETLSRFITISYDRWHRISQQLAILFTDAGHILGSAAVTLKIHEQGREKMIGFTGDIGRPERPILRDPQPMPQVELLICESTYGNRKHEAGRDQYKKLYSVIQKTCVENKGRLIIPAFSLGRTQEIVFLLDKMENAGELPKIPVYVDSPLSVNATRIFRLHPECYDQKLKDYIEFDPDPFGFNGLNYITAVDESKAINQHKGPCIIISSSGMANAGRVRHHIANSVSDPKNTILIVGYCAPGTTGAHLRSQPRSVTLFGQTHNIKASIEVMDSFSAHADLNELLDFLEHQKKKLRKIFLVHGSKSVKEDFSRTLIENGYINVIIPEEGKEYDH